MIKRTIKCDICGVEAIEPIDGGGWPGWGGLNGIALDGVPNPSLCPKHLAQVADFIDGLKGESDDGLD